MIPIGIDRPNQRKPRVVPVLIVLNIGVFLLMLGLHFASPVNPETGYSAPEQTLLHLGWVDPHHFRVWTLITSAFLHGGFMHLFGNMLALFVFGPSVEDRFGRIGFTIFYLASAVGSALAHIAVEDAPAIGASGAIAAVTGAFLVLFPLTRVRVLMFFGFIGLYRIPAVWLIGLYVALDLFSQTFEAENGVANMAHLGGYGFGIVTALALLWTRILPREPYDLFTMLNHRRRRQAFKAAHNQIQSKPVFNHSKSRPDPRAELLARARAEVSGAISNDRMDEAADLYARLISDFADKPRATTLHRDAQYRLANHLYATGQRARAADAYQRLLDAYPSDHEREVISVLLARVKSQDLGDTNGALEILNGLLKSATNPEIRMLVEQELTQLKGES
ncbi:MAG: rhomboid family intramembrane serine protease [Phycisphaerales bacterium]|nr:rhomboid family intramembrane serine protease [Phycisphaerales bacterium]